jgi:hypothetical protein
MKLSSIFKEKNCPKLRSIDSAPGVHCFYAGAPEEVRILQTLALPGLSRGRTEGNASPGRGNNLSIKGMFVCIHT